MLASNRQRKLLKFFGVSFHTGLTAGAAGWEIQRLLSDESNRELWRRYLYLTRDFDTDSDELKPFDPVQLASTEIPDDWDHSEQGDNFLSELAAGIVERQGPFDVPEPAIEYNGRTFVFTGKFEYGQRKACESAVTKRGGTCSSGASASVDYLVIGKLGNEQWSKGTYGQKIERAIVLRREHGKPAIISEEHWIASLG